MLPTFSQWSNSGATSDGALKCWHGNTEEKIYNPWHFEGEIVAACLCSLLFCSVLAYISYFSKNIFCMNGVTVYEWVYIKPYNVPQATILNLIKRDNVGEGELQGEHAVPNWFL